MTTAASDLLATFNSLSPAEQHDVTAAILRKAADAGNLPEAALDELAAEVFRAYDAEEAARAEP